MAFAFLSHIGLLYILPHIVCQKIADYPNVQYLIGSSSWPEQAVWKGVVVCSCLVLKCRS